MITTKEELRHYLTEDAARYEGRTPSWIDGLFQNEKWYAFQLVKELRYVEYYTNSSHKGLMGGGKKILLIWHKLLYKRLCWKTHCYIAPNSTGPGMIMFHLGSTIYIRETTKIGKNFTFIGGLLVGKKTDEVGEHAEIGDNCFIGFNTTIIGNVHIGNNVTIGAGSVVVKDLPDNCVAAGNPAKILKYKD